jgi:long-chain acyl-CoA synthetase
VKRTALTSSDSPDASDHSLRGIDILDARRRRDPHLPAFADGLEAVTYEVAHKRALARAAELVRLGVRPGNVVAVLARNSVDTALTYFAGWLAGAIPAPVNYRLSSSEIARQVRLLDPALVVTDASLRDVVPDGYGVLELGRNVSRAGRRRKRRGIATAAGADAPAAVFFTSGTTGEPRAVVLGHRGLARNCATVPGAIDLRRGDRFVLATALCHVGGITRMLNAVYTGATVDLVTGWDPSAFVRRVSGTQATHTMLVGAMLADLLELPDEELEQLRSLRIVYYGAGRTDPQMIRALVARRPGIGLAQGWGSTETSGSVTLLTPADHVRGIGVDTTLLQSAGRPLPGVSLEIDRDESMPDGVGTIAVRCPGLLLGTLAPEGLVAEPLENGYLRTGDLGRVDAGGYLHVVGRSDDAIRSGGLTVMPSHVEEALLAYPAVREAVVFGVPDARFGEAVTACVVFAAGAKVDLDDLRDVLRTRLGGFELPQTIDVVDSLPRNPAGKLDRVALRTRAGATAVAS